jgi:hypothetical protein
MEWVRTRSGSSVKLKPEVNDIIVRTSHSGDCFSYFAVFREGKRIGDWCGYEPDAEYLGNVVDSMKTFPGVSL